MIVCWQRVTPTDIFGRGEKSSVHSAEMRGNPLFPRGMYDKLLTVSKSRVKFLTRRLSGESRFSGAEGVRRSFR